MSFSSILKENPGLIDRQLEQNNINLKLVIGIKKNWFRSGNLNPFCHQVKIKNGRPATRSVICLEVTKLWYQYFFSTRFDCWH